MPGSNETSSLAASLPPSPIWPVNFAVISTPTRPNFDPFDGSTPIPLAAFIVTNSLRHATSQLDYHASSRATHDRRPAAQRARLDRTRQPAAWRCWRPYPALSSRQQPARQPRPWHPLTVGGARPQQNNYRVDGISINDYSNGGPGGVIGSNLGVDAIQEFSVVTSNATADYGKSAGGVINAVTRAGTTDCTGALTNFSATARSMLATNSTRRAKSLPAAIIRDLRRWTSHPRPHLCLRRLRRTTPVPGR